MKSIEQNLSYFVHRVIDTGTTSLIERLDGKQAKRKDVLAALQLQLLGDFYDCYQNKSAQHTSQLIDMFYSFGKQHKLKVDASLNELESNIYKAESLLETLVILN